MSPIGGMRELSVRSAIRDTPMMSGALIGYPRCSTDALDLIANAMTGVISSS